MYLRTDGRTDSQTDKLIWGGLGNLRFLQVSAKYRCLSHILFVILRTLAGFIGF